MEKKQQNSTNSTFNTPLFSTKEIEADSTIHTNMLRGVYRRVKALLKAEAKNKKRVPAAIRGKFILSPEELLDKTVIKISMRILYRKYRGVYLHALTEALSIVDKYEKKEDVKSAIIGLLVELGQAEKTSKDKDK